MADATIATMTWDDAHYDSTPAGRDEVVELVGTNLRMTGLISLGRFPRLTDLINSTSGYISDQGGTTAPTGWRAD